MKLVKYRALRPNLTPRRTRVTVPGWAGQSEPRADGSQEYPWHCIPFSEAARSGFELCYPHEDELRVSAPDGFPIFEGDFGDAADPNARRPPFRTFGRQYYTYQLLLDLKVEADFAIKTETHPRFYTDTTGTVPVAVPAMIQHWWPMIYFVVFKTPPAGQTHIFRPNEPFIQISIVPSTFDFELMAMPEDEAAERELHSRRIHASRTTLSADTEWTSATNTVFDGTYRRIYGAAKSARDR